MPWIQCYVPGFDRAGTASLAELGGLGASMRPTSKSEAAGRIFPALSTKRQTPSISCFAPSGTSPPPRHSSDGRCRDAWHGAHSSLAPRNTFADRARLMYSTNSWTAFLERQQPSRALGHAPWSACRPRRWLKEGRSHLFDGRHALCPCRDRESLEVSDSFRSARSAVDQALATNRECEAPNPRDDDFPAEMQDRPPTS